MLQVITSWVWGVYVFGGMGDPHAASSSGDVLEPLMVSDKDVNMFLDTSLVSHEGFVFMDRDPLSGVTYITHMGTFERKEAPSLPDGQRWSLEFDEDGFGILVGPRVDDEEPKIVFVEDMLQNMLYVSEDKTVEYLVASAGPSQGTYVNLTDFREAFVETTLATSIGVIKKDVVVDLAVFKLPRQGGQKVFVSLASLYKAMALQQYSGESWRWVNNGLPKWTTLLDKAGVVNGMELSAQTRGKNVKAAARASRKIGSLPFNGVCMSGVLLLLDRFSARSEKLCGFRLDENRCNAEETLSAFLAMLSDGGAWELSVEIATQWNDPWPRPMLYNNIVQIKFEDGIVMLDDWAAVALRQGPSSLAGRTWAEISNVMGTCRSVDLFFRTLGNHDSNVLPVLFHQFLCCAGRRLQNQFTRAVRGEVKLSTAVLKLVELDDLFDNRGRMDAYLFRYVMSCRPKFKGQQYWSLCTDKANSGSFSIQGGLAVLPSNLAAVAPPQVS
jgi:hypothetical protein